MHIRGDQQIPALIGGNRLQTLADTFSEGRKTMHKYRHIGSFQGGEPVGSLKSLGSGPSASQDAS